MLTVTGQAGAVPGSFSVFLQSLQTGSSAKTTSARDGSFQADVLATEGSTIVVGYGDAQARNLMDGSPAVQTTVHLPRPSSPTEVPFQIAGPDGVGTGYWVAEGTQNGWSYRPGDTIRYTIDFTYTSPNLTGNIDLEEIQAHRLYPRLNLSRMSDAKGDPVQATFIPVLMTPTGLPIFSRDGYEHNAEPFAVTVRSIEQTGDILTMSLDFSQRIPEWLPSGYYVGRLRWEPRSIWQDTQPASPPSGSEHDLLLRGGAAAQTLLPVMRIGTPAPPRVPWMLLANTLSNGTRGVVAREDEGKFDLGNKVTFNASKIIIPKDGSHRLEPFLPTIGFHMGGPNRVAPPLVSFLFPSGELHVTVTRPDGTVEDLGRAPFRSARTDPGIVFGPTSVQALYELTTLDPSFEYEFSAYGHYVVRMEGWVQDATGITFSGGGSYDVYVAETLDLDLGTFLNTPFEVGDTMSPVVHTRPGVPADVTVELKLFPNSSAQDVISTTLTGRANRYGYFHPGSAAERLTISSPGEYVVDVNASYTDQDGVLWMGSTRGASVVETPDTSLVAHGKRGIATAGVEPGSTPQWFFMINIDPPGLNGEEEGQVPQVFYPYNTGDVQWAADGSASGIFPIITLHDPEGVTGLGSDPRSQGKDVLGELEVLFPAIQPMNLPAVQYPELIETWAYYYTSVQRQ